MNPRREQRPTLEAPPEVPAEVPVTRVTVGTVISAEPRQPIAALVSTLTFEDREAARLAGVEQGLAERRRLDISDAVQDALHDQARAAVNMTRRYAAAKGPHWAQMITECGERDD